MNKGTGRGSDALGRREEENSYATPGAPGAPVGAAAAVKGLPKHVLPDAPS